MAVGQGYDLVKLLECRLFESCGVDIAVARAAPCPAIDELGAFCAGGGLLRVVVGIDGNATDPAALRQLARFGQLRVGAGSTVWVGSADLTRGGFGGNDGLMLESEGGQASVAWFESLWSSLAPDPAERIAAYERDRSPRADAVGGES